MTGRRTLRFVIALSLAEISGIIGMLLVDGSVWDDVLFFIAALPLLVGAWRAWRMHQARA